MKLWVISQNTNIGYDTYDSAVVAAETEDDARNIHPSGNNKDFETPRPYGSWVAPEAVHVAFIGVTDRKFVNPIICASFNAG